MVLCWHQGHMRTMDHASAFWISIWCLVPVAKVCLKLILQALCHVWAERRNVACRLRLVSNQGISVQEAMCYADPGLSSKIAAIQSVDLVAVQAKVQKSTSSGSAWPLLTTWQMSTICSNQTEEWMLNCLDLLKQPNLWFAEQPGQFAEPLSATSPGGRCCPESKRVEGNNNNQINQHRLKCPV